MTMFDRIGLRPCRRPRENRRIAAAKAVDRESHRGSIREKSDSVLRKMKPILAGNLCLKPKGFNPVQTR